MAVLQGRGYASTAEVSMIDAREEACCVVRPLLGVPRKELALHCYFSGVPFLSDSRPASIKASITSQTEEFISDLYVRLLFLPTFRFALPQSRCAVLPCHRATSFITST